MWTRATGTSISLGLDSLPSMETWATSTTLLRNNRMLLLPSSRRRVKTPPRPLRESWSLPWISKLRSKLGPRLWSSLRLRSESTQLLTKRILIFLRKSRLERCQRLLITKRIACSSGSERRESCISLSILLRLFLSSQKWRGKQL